ncbi:hypothetical protein OC842_004567 [Tilletia horrida]|uniref:Uncharacterized protein n=1 Tax=Tilletia horrida TaxID=155126 RepID=A0AAN6G9F2_9BASI|nr:hypothetical protein OC842_004567 [Tilletia horrida]
MVFIKSNTTARRQKRRRSRQYRLLGSAFAISYSLAALPLLASPAEAGAFPLAAGTQSSSRSLLSSPSSSSSLFFLARRGSQQSSPQPPSLTARFIDTVKDRWHNGGNALPRAPLAPSSSSVIVLYQRQAATDQVNVSDNTPDPAPADTGANHGPESDQPITVGNTQITPLILLIAGMAFSIICCLFLIIIINCGNPNNSATGRDRLRAQQDLRLRGAGRRSVAEPYVFGTGASGASTPNYGGSAAGHGRRASRIDRRPPPRSGMGSSISSRTPLYSSRNSHASGSVSGSDRLLLASSSGGGGRAGHNSFLSTSSGPFGDSMAALSVPDAPSRYSDRAGPSRLAGGGGGSGSGSGNGYRPSPLPLPPMQQHSFEVASPGSPRSPRPLLYAQGRPRTHSDSPSVKASRSSTIGRGTDIYRNRGSRAYVPAVQPSAVAPAYPNWARDYGGSGGGAHPLEGSSELKRHLTDPAQPGSLAASRRNSMLSLSVGSNSNEGSASPNHTGNGMAGGGTSPDSASSSHLSTFSQGLTTGPLLPLGSSYLTSSGNAGLGSASNAVPTGDLLSSGGFFGSGSTGLMGGPSTIAPPPSIGQRRSPVPAVGGVGGMGSAAGGSGAPPIPPQKSIYHSRATGAPSLTALEGSSRAGGYGASAYDVSGGGRTAGGAGAGAGFYSVGPQRQNDDIEAAGPRTGAGAGGGRYARRPLGPR